MKNLHLAAIGDNCIDKFLSLGIGRVGGNALNVSVHFSKLGNRSSYFGVRVQRQ